MHNRKVIVRIIGGLGNQLFSYAAARRLALENNAELVLDDVSGFVRDYQFTRNYQLDHFNIPCRKATAAERLEPFSRLRRKLKRSFNARKAFSKRSYIMQEEVDFDQRLLNLEVQGTLYIEGYWQSERYFKDVEEVIRRDLQIRPPEDGMNKAMADEIGKEQSSVALHLRYFDTGADNGNNLNLQYYDRAIAGMEDIVPGAHFFVFSDHPEMAGEHLPLPSSRMTVVSHNSGDVNAFADLWLMQQCRHFIIANSTFSWWGAWLSTNPDKRIFAPALEKRTGVSWWGFDGLIPSEWNLV